MWARSVFTSGPVFCLLTQVTQDRSQPIRAFKRPTLYKIASINIWIWYFLWNFKGTVAFKRPTLYKIASINIWIWYFLWNFKGTVWNSAQTILPWIEICVFYLPTKIEELIAIRVRYWRFWNGPNVFRLLSLVGNTPALPLDAKTDQNVARVGIWVYWR